MSLVNKRRTSNHGEGVRRLSFRGEKVAEPIDDIELMLSVAPFAAVANKFEDFSRGFTSYNSSK
jgi:hypothetical protein